MSEQTKIENVGPDELHAIIMHGQMAMWDTDEEGVQLPYCTVPLDTKAILHYFYTQLPDEPEAEHYRHCQTCARSILLAGNWVVANYDGTLDSVMFPSCEIADNFKNGWTELLEKMNTFITRRVTADNMTDTAKPRVVKGTVCRPLDGGTYPRFTRGDERRHFNVFTTPRQLESSRTLCKANDRMFALAKKITASKGLTSTNIAGLIDLHGRDHNFGHDVYTAINAASIVLWNVDQYADCEEKRNNILTLACGYSEGLQRFPTELLDILDAFEEHSDYELLLKSLGAAQL